MALMPIRVVQAEADAKYLVRLIKLKSQAPFQQSQTFSDSGWAMTPGSEKPHLALFWESAKNVPVNGLSLGGTIRPSLHRRLA
ncbi:MAG: hypothetical protein OSB69_07580 [Alphaproteobacteria bacterium]|nr:hypothetical protein [Alphaproteobacteria bacterium]